jgi:RND family efflux transporter MFP subunit
MRFIHPGSAAGKTALLLGVLIFAATCFAQRYEGFLEPNQKVDLTPPFRGILGKLYVREGDRVKPGMLVAELDSRVLNAELKSARKVMTFHGKVDSARALLDLRENHLQSLETLMKSGNARNREVERARTEVVMARAGLQMAREEKQLSRLEYEKILARIEERKIRSPIGGVVVRIYKKRAELVGGVQGDPLMTIVQLDPLKAVFHMPPGDTAALKPGGTVFLQVASRPGRVEGLIEFVSPVIEPDSGTVRVTVRVPNEKGAVQAGTRCTLETGAQTTVR